MTAALEAVDLRKSFGPRAALRGVSLSLAPGEVCALFGPNGAGKTTLLKLLAGLSRATAGSARLFGADPRDPSVRARVGVLGHATFLHDALTAEENLRFYGRLYGLGDLDARVASVLEEVGLADRARDRVSSFSRGMRQRLAIARTVLHDPQVILLDEPFTGLDRAAARALGAFLRSLANRDRTLLAVTHELDVSLDLATRVAILSAGKLVHDAPASAADRAGFERLYLEAVGDATSAPAREAVR